MIAKRWIRGTLVAGLLTALAVGPSVAGNKGFGGKSGGSWNTASNGGSGFATGTFTPGRFGGSPLYLMGLQLNGKGKLDPFLGAVQAKSGSLEGTLQSFPLSPQGSPFAFVNGTWSIDDEATGEGSFYGSIFTISGIGPLGPPFFLIGEIEGTFVDPPSSPTGPDFLGSYTAKWKLF